MRPAVAAAPRFTEACVLFTGGIFVLTTLLADVLYTLLNPRIRQAVLK